MILINASMILHTPADILIAGRDRGKPATLDINITSPLLRHLGESCQLDREAYADEDHSNGPNCQELGWSCMPLAVGEYGN